MAQEEKKVYGNKPKVTKEVDLKVEQYDYCFNLLQDEKGVRIAVGNQVVTATVFADMESAKAYVDSKPWQLIMATAHVCLRKFDEMQAQTAAQK